MVAFQLQLSSEPVQRAKPFAPVCIDQKATVREALDAMQKEGRGSILVLDGEALVGIFTERDAVHLMAKGADLGGPIQQVMSPNPVSVSADETVQSAIKKMSAGGYRHLPVVDGEGRPIGILNVAHILRYLVEHFPQYIYNLPPVPHHTVQQREGA